MSTNYRWYVPLPKLPNGEKVPVDTLAPAIHIGKRFYAGKDVGMGFIWAQEPERVKRVCRKHREVTIIENEYGELLTGGEFLDVIRCVRAHDYSKIGGYFS